MARRKLFIPEEVKEDIRKHLSERYPIALDGYNSANEEEDTLTGDLGATLRIKNQKVFVEKGQKELPGYWKWSIDYHKFRGRGPGATENKLGADGIFELKLIVGTQVEKKSLMFQSKINLTNNDPKLINETIKLTTWREASFILNFTSTEFEAIDLDSIIATRGRRTNNMNVIPLDKFIGHNFLDCIVGDVDLKYDAISRKLTWRTTSGQFVATKFSIPQRISINITAPNNPFDHDLRFEKEILHDEIHNYRMDASEEEILSLNDNYTENEIKEARTSKALIYHSDRFSLGDSFLDSIMNRRMQEINSAYESLKRKK
ncbi:MULTISPECIES: J domain-containing protein [unclassified Arcicella]|uniref:J domain-containing protein n=1 Tax=unclassified Arcicella TaxID=2644986 RepID=UPI00285AD01B|nr:MULTISPECIES: J domain-containing protein [unclassified Arcicella]MDR6563197.1 hypothetical protein [Arcicella sp. BE51]MDR6811652.1 hypothetical protein [Arcicella sp. BE140]MDR6823177.1 hypothetical protein [Arcicella sp. BE139]